MPYTDKEAQREYNKRYNETHREERREYRKAHREQARQALRRWRADHPESQRKYQQEHREQANEQSRNWRKAHPEQVRDYQRKYDKTRTDTEQRRRRNKEWQRTHLEQVRAANYKRKYGLTIGEAQQLVIEQLTGVCAACGGNRSKQALCVDHDHATRKIRGLLCHKCNVALGYMADNPDWVQSLADYIRQATEASKC